MSVSDDLPQELRNHRQLEQASCAVSAFEAVAKLHGLIDKQEFPLQSDKKNQGRGFDDTEFLSSLGISASDDHYDIQSALGLIETETNQGRFPLVSRIAAIVNNRRYWHICLCAQHNSKLLLIDPAEPKVVCDKKEDLRTALEGSLLPDRPKLHILTYTLGTPDTNPKA